jgi:hypothetical protein
MVRASPSEWRLRNAPSIVIKRRGNMHVPLGADQRLQTLVQGTSGSPVESASLFHPDHGQGHGLGRVALFGITGDEGNRQS